MRPMRAMGCPAGSLDGPRAARLAEAIAEYEVAPQVGYHERHSVQIEMLDHRLGFPQIPCDKGA